MEAKTWITYPDSTSCTVFVAMREGDSRWHVYSITTDAPTSTIYHRSGGYRPTDNELDAWMLNGTPPETPMRWF